MDKNIVKTAVEKYNDDFFTRDSKRLLNLSFGRVYWFQHLLVATYLGPEEIQKVCILIPARSTTS